LETKKLLSVVECTLKLRAASKIKQKSPARSRKYASRIDRRLPRKSLTNFASAPKLCRNFVSFPSSRSRHPYLAALNAIVGDNLFVHLRPNSFGAQNLRFVPCSIQDKASKGNGQRHRRLSTFQGIALVNAAPEQMLHFCNITARTCPVDTFYCIISTKYGIFTCWLECWATRTSACCSIA
jgi:hypothetical protein